MTTATSFSARTSVARPGVQRPAPRRLAPLRANPFIGEVNDPEKTKKNKEKKVRTSAQLFHAGSYFAGVQSSLSSYGKTSCSFATAHIFAHGMSLRNDDVHGFMRTTTQGCANKLLITLGKLGTTQSACR